MNDYAWAGGSIPLPGSNPEACAYIPPFTLSKGSVVILTASSGRGKSFFLSVLSGTANLAAVKGAERRRALGAISRPLPLVFVPQSPALRTDLTLEVEAELTWAAHLAALPSLKKTQYSARLEDLLRIFDLQNERSVQLSKLSGGGLKRAGLLLRFAVPAPFILLDEPDSGLDEMTAEKTFSRLFQTFRANSAFLIVTHNPDIIRRAAGGDATLVSMVANPDGQSEQDRVKREDLAVHKPVRLPSAPPGTLSAAARLSLDTLLPKFTDLLFNIGLAAAIYGLVSVGREVPDLDATDRFAKHAFFAIIASTWLGVQFSAHAFMQNWESWRGDAIWRSGLRGSAVETDAPRNSALFLFSLLTSAAVGSALRTMVGVGVMVWLGYLNGWIDRDPLPMAAVVDLLTVCLLAAGYGTAWGVFAASSLSAFDTQIQNRKPNQFWLQLTIPLIVLAHLIFSARFLDVTVKSLGRTWSWSTWLEAVTKSLPTNRLAEITETYKRGPMHTLLADGMKPYGFILLSSLALLALGWLFTTILVSTKDIREK